MPSIFQLYEIFWRIVNTRKSTQLIERAPLLLNCMKRAWVCVKEIKFHSVSLYSCSNWYDKIAQIVVSWNFRI